MSRYAREARRAAMKCVSCNAPVVQTVGGSYVCVECGQSPVQTTVMDSIEVSVGTDGQANDEETVLHSAK